MDYETLLGHIGEALEAQKQPPYTRDCTNLHRLVREVCAGEDPEELAYVLKGAEPGFIKLFFGNLPLLYNVDQVQKLFEVLGGHDDGIIIKIFESISEETSVHIIGLLATPQLQMLKDYLE